MKLQDSSKTKGSRREKRNLKTEMKKERRPGIYGSPADEKNRNPTRNGTRKQPTRTKEKTETKNSRALSKTEHPAPRHASLEICNIYQTKETKKRKEGKEKKHAGNNDEKKKTKAPTNAAAVIRNSGNVAAAAATAEMGRTNERTQVPERDAGRRERGKEMPTTQTSNRQ